MRWQRTTKREPLWIVLLLRKPHLFTAAELRLAAGRAWHRSFHGEAKESMHFVSQVGTATRMEAGPQVLSFFFYPGPEVEKPGDYVDWLPQSSQRHVCIQHAGCLGINYLNDGVSVELGYSVLSQLIAEMLDGTCTGIYIPTERSLAPDDESRYLELHRLGSACESSVNSST
jgi:hypothetical protein